MDYAHMALSSTIAMNGLTVKSIYTTNNGGDNDGAMTLTCTAPDGRSISVRTVVLTDAEGKLITASYFANKTIDVKGIVDYFDGSYQIKVFSLNDITIK